MATTAITIDECIGNVKRLLEFAEAETDLMKMERLEKLADSWIALAHTVKLLDELSWSA